MAKLDLQLATETLQPWLKEALTITMNQPINGVNSDTFERVLKLIEEIRIHEREFNSPQANCRGIASA